MGQVVKDAVAPGCGDVRGDGSRLSGFLGQGDVHPIAPLNRSTSP